MGKKNKNFPKANQAQSVRNDRYDFDPDDFDAPDVRQDSHREAKRQKFAKASKPSSTSSNFNPVYVIVPSVLIIIIGALLFFQNQPSSGSSASAANVIREVPIQVTQEGGKLAIPVEEVRTKKLVTFDYKNGSKVVPLTAWVSPSGQIKTAVRICEPCNGYSFRIEGNVIVCNSCGTRWDLETLRGISGGCTAYPPDVLPSTTNGDTIIMDVGPIEAWKRRA